MLNLNTFDLRAKVIIILVAIGKHVKDVVQMIIESAKIMMNIIIIARLLLVPFLKCWETIVIIIITNGLCHSETHAEAMCVTSDKPGVVALASHWSSSNQSNIASYYLLIKCAWEYITGGLLLL